ncbi:FAD binding domain-containing protein [Streptomyces sp. NPDC001393]
MKPAPFVYIAPDSLGEALEALGEYGADGKVLAGGQSLVPMMNMRLARPSTLIDITRIPGLAGIRHNGRISIGATTRQREVGADADIAKEFPVIPAALRHVGHIANRGRGTFGGSVAHADPAAEIPAVMLALDAEMVIHGPDGERVITADDFFLTYYTTDLGFDEVLTEVRLPHRAPTTWGFREVARRHGDFALTGAVVTATTDADDVVQSARVVLFGVTDRPVRGVSAEKALVGRRLGDAGLAEEAGHLAAQGIDFTSDIHVPGTYRRDTSIALVQRTIQDAARTVGS